MDSKRNMAENNPSATLPTVELMPPPGYNQTYPGIAPAPMAYPENPGNMGNPMINTVFAETAAMVLPCPHCDYNGKTVLRRENGIKNHLIAIMMCMTVMCIPCMWVPYCIEALKDANHYCTACGKMIGKQMSPMDQLGYNTARRRYR